MEKVMKSIVLVAIAAMTLVSCQEKEINGLVKQEVQFTIKAGIESKTLITNNGDGTYTPYWTKGDKIGVAFDAPGKSVEFENTSDAGIIATFEGKSSFEVGDTPEVSGKMYAFFPSSAYNKVYDNGEVRLDLAATQSPSSSSFDPSCDLLIARPCYYTAEATGSAAEVLIDDMHFARMMSVLKVNLNSEFLADEPVKSISFKAEGLKLSGAMRFNLDQGTFVGNQSTGDLSEVKAVYSEDPIVVAGEKNAAYLVVAPITIPTGTNLTFTIETENYDIVKAVTAKEDMSFPSGDIAVINLNILETECEERAPAEAETRIWVEGFDGETTNKTQTTAAKSGAIGTGVSSDLEYSYSTSNCNVRINSNGQSSDNPFLYINAANSSFTASSIKVENVETLALSAMIKGNGLKLTVEYKESSATSWTSAGVINGTSSFALGRVLFAVSNTVTSLDIRLTGSGVMFVDDIVLEETSEEIPEATLESIVVSGQTTSFSVGDEFVFDGTVTAKYSNGQTKDVTSLVSVSIPDMVNGETITVSYTEASITKSVEYTITVLEEGAEVSKTYREMFSNYSNTATSNSTAVTITGDACSWTGKGVTTAYWSNFSWGDYSKGVTFLKPGSPDAVYLVSETLSGGISHLSIAAAANNTSATIQVSVINVDNNNQEIVLGTVKTTTKKTKFTGEWDVAGVAGNYQIKITNHTTAAYLNVTDIAWQ